MRRLAGAVLIALPIVAFLTAMVINKGWGYVLTMLAMTALSGACVVGGTHLLSSKSKNRKQP